MSTFSVTQVEGVWHFKGLIGEDADFGPLRGAAPITLNFRQVIAINSIGARNMINFTQAWGARQVTYAECAPCVVDALLMLPALLGPEEATANVASLYIPYNCGKCNQQASLLIQAAEIKAKGADLVWPIRVCPRCANFLKPDQLAEDLGQLVEAGALRPGA